METNIKVFVYYNLHKKVWSIKDLKTNKVIGHSQYVLLQNCTFKVSQKGRERVIRERRKNVHAGIVGTLVASSELGENLNLALSTIKTGHIVRYNPYQFETFVYGFENTPISHSNTVMMCASSVPSVYAA